MKRKTKVYAIIQKLNESRIRQRLFLILWIIIVLMGNVPASTKGLDNHVLKDQGTSPIRFGVSMNWLEQLPPGTTVYYLKKGDTMYRLSQLYMVSLVELLAINHIHNSNRLAVNTKIYIPPVNYAVYNLQKYYPKPGDTRERLCALYNLELWQWKRLNPVSGSAPVYREGVPTEAVFLPRYPLPVIYKPRNLRTQQNLFQITRPVSGWLSSRFGFRWGRMHSGVDLAAPAGTPVKAALAGRVIFAGWRGGYGLLVIMNHGRVRTYYGHLSVILVRGGQTVSRGAKVGLVGSTGHAYGSHLHFEVERDGRKTNPLSYFSYPY